MPLSVKKQNSAGRHPMQKATVWAALCATLTLSACASLGSRPPEEQVRLRATERWSAMIAKDINRAYTFNTPGYRAVVKPEVFSNRFGSAVTWVGSEVIAVECAESTKCVAKIRIDFKPLLSARSNGKMNTHIDETWLLEDGQWWIYQPVNAN